MNTFRPQGWSNGSNTLSPPEILCECTNTHRCHCNFRAPIVAGFSNLHRKTLSRSVNVFLFSLGPHTSKLLVHQFVFRHSLSKGLRRSSCDHVNASTNLARGGIALCISLFHFSSVISGPALDSSVSSISCTDMHSLPCCSAYSVIAAARLCIRGPLSTDGTFSSNAGILWPVAAQFVSSVLLKVPHAEYPDWLLVVSTHTPFNAPSVWREIPLVTHFSVASESCTGAPAVVNSRLFFLDFSLIRPPFVFACPGDVCNRFGVFSPFGRSVPFIIRVFVYGVPSWFLRNAQPRFHYVPDIHKLQ